MSGRKRKISTEMERRRQKAAIRKRLLALEKELRNLCSEFSPSYGSQGKYRLVWVNPTGRNHLNEAYYKIHRIIGLGLIQ